MSEEPQMVEIRYEGVRAANDTQHARAQALLHGIRLAALCGNIWPRDDDGLSKLIGEEVLNELLAFAINARRFLELRDMKHLNIQEPLHRINLPEYRYETSVWTAVNRVVHANEMRVVLVERPRVAKPKHDNLGDLVIACVQVTSPQRDKIAICPQALFFGFAAED